MQPSNLIVFAVFQLEFLFLDYLYRSFLFRVLGVWHSQYG